MKFEFIWNFGICQLFEKSFIFILCHFSFFSVPNCLNAINLLSIQSDRITNKLRKLLYNFLYLNLFTKLSAICFQLNQNLSSSIEIQIGCFRNNKLSRAIRYPSNSRLILSFCIDFNFISNNKTTIKSNSKLPNYRT